MEEKAVVDLDTDQKKQKKGGGTKRKLKEKVKRLSAQVEYLMSLQHLPACGTQCACEHCWKKRRLCQELNGKYEDGLTRREHEEMMDYVANQWWQEEASRQAKLFAHIKK